MPTFDTPGVFIEEQTGPGVIAGVGTSTAGFIGPAKRGPINVAQRISSYDAFLSLYAMPDKKGNLDPFITTPQTFYLAHAVRGYFENGGRQAFIVRIGNAEPTSWKVKSSKSQELFTIEALDPGPQGDDIDDIAHIAHIEISVQSSSLANVKVAVGNSAVTGLAGKDVRVDNTSDFRAGDLVTVKKADDSEGADPFKIEKITGKTTLTLNDAPPAGIKAVRIADIAKGQKTVRMASTVGLFPGSIVEISNGTKSDVALIANVAATDFVTFASGLAEGFPLANAPNVKSREFSLAITAPGFESEAFKDLSFERNHPRFAGSAVRSKLVQLKAFVASSTLDPVHPELKLPTATSGKGDDLNTLKVAHFEAGLDALARIDDVNLLCIPDAAGRADCESIQDKMVLHCEKLQDRFAILDSQRNLTPDGVQLQREGLDSERGFGALYYPWLEVLDPGSSAVPPNTMFIPPSGHIAGVFARTDQERGVHKAPANTDVRGILGLEKVLSDREQGPLNLKGINVLRIFPGSRTVVVWGARTIVNPAISDWLYVNVRRLLLFIEESIQEGIRPAVFEPNAPPLWKALKRTITQFLTQVWRDGGLFGDTPDQAFRVRIDEALNPPSERARGKLFIEIRVAPVRPAEFIVVRIGLFDGGADVQEG
jgi:uncharacterized protein